MKPVEIAEVIVRVQALLRRGLVLRENVLRFGGLGINRLKQQVRRGGKTIALNAKEFAILEYLVLNSDHVLSRDTILDKLWDHCALASQSAKSVMPAQCGRLAFLEIGSHERP